MTKTKRLFVLGACFLSGAAAIISFISLGTQEWVTSDVLDGDNDAGDLNFGLFGGSFRQVTIIEQSFDWTIVCLFDENVCALVCGSNQQENLRILYNGGSPPDTETSCLNIQSNKFLTKKAVDGDESTTINPNVHNNYDNVYINCGVWLTTIIFLLISTVLGVFSAGLSIWNTVSNPYQVYFSIYGLYIYNAIAAGSLLLSMILWGAMFAQDLTHNIPSYKTLKEKFSTDGLAQLGINIISIVLYMTSIALLLVRNYLLSKEPVSKIHVEDNSDPVIYLY